ncbi:MAG: NHL repeat-containing protein [Mycobacteriales bacterium]
MLAASRHRQTVYRRRRIAVLTVLVVLIGGGYLLIGRGHSTAASRPPQPGSHGVTKPGAATNPAIPAAPAGEVGHLQAGSNPAVLPGPVLIADKHNNRLIVVDQEGRIVWEFPRPGDLAPGQTFLVPDDAFFSPDGRYIVATEEGDFVVTVIDVATHRIVWRYGTPGVPGGTFDHLDNPDDAMLLPGGDVIAADIKNCRLIVIAPGGTALLHTFGTLGDCYHNPPVSFGSPNGMFPLPDGNYLITEINGDWVDEMTPTGQILWSAHPPGFDYPSDSNQYAPGVYLSVDYTSPGALDLFNRAGQLIYQYAPTGPQALNLPSLAMPLPNGDILMNDDHNDRVVVLDPRTSQIVWQYGVTGVPGSAPGYLDVPDGVDLAPPHSLLIIHAATLTPPS